LVANFCVTAACLAFYCWLFYLAISWVGFKFLSAELPRKGNEQLLHNLKEGVFIVDDETDIVRFHNTAAKSINAHLQTKHNFGLVHDDEMPVFDREACKYHEVDASRLQTAEIDMLEEAAAADEQSADSQNCEPSLRAVSMKQIIRR